MTERVSVAAQPGNPRAPRRLCATYRVQMNARFTLRDLTAVVPYLDRLGVSHVYCSPLLAAKAGSMHGYDVTDPTKLNPELGNPDDLRALVEALRARDMGLLLDIVPNHMSASAQNRFWMDVLARGEHSRWAHWFDIDWNAPGADRKLVLPVLGGSAHEVLDRGELRLVHDSAGLQIAYFDKRFPLRADALPPALQVAVWDPEAGGSVPALLTPDEMLHLLDAQHYRLTGWREAVPNYRRFFDVNDLVALRMEDPRVFDETHGTVLDWIAEGLVDGLRVDHVDGLRDPRAYLTRLRAAVEARSAGRGTAGPLPIFVEKILAANESLRDDWPVQGTTGYEFLNDVEDLFVDPDGFAHVERGYRALRRLAPGEDFAAAARAGKRHALESGLRGDLARVARAAAADPRMPAVSGDEARPDNAERLAAAIADLIEALPVYRTYIHAATLDQPDHRDVGILNAAAGDASSDSARDVAEAIKHPGVEAVSPPGERDAHLDFVERFQQLSGPAAARGIEDTALYVYVPLVSRNEVGGSPDRDLPRAVERFHAGNRARAERWPLNLLCTDTHDTKHGADVRARLDAVSGCASEWHRCIQRWRRLNARHRVAIEGRLAPDTNTEYLLYQILVGLWPAPRPGRRVDDLPDERWREAIRPRVQEYMRKAAREAKRRTNWTEPDAAYEAALARFIDAVLEPSADAPFLQDLARFVARVADTSFWIGAARTLLHCTSPGTPDIYQGTELASAVLVDPDNRRPVDFAGRLALLEQSGAGRSVPAAKLDAGDTGARLLLTARLLHARRDDEALYTRGAYLPVPADGLRAGNVVAFARMHGGRIALVAAPRLAGAGKRLPRDAAWWGDTRLRIPAQVRETFARARWRNVLTDADVALPLSALGDAPIASVFSDVPLALLTGS